MKEVADLFLLGIAVIFLTIASISDIKKKEVPNWLNFSLLAIALAIRAIAALIMQEFSYFWWALIAVAIFYGLGELFYHTTTFGGADTKLFVALAAVFATRPYFSEATFLGEPFLATLLINSLFLGSAWGIIYVIYSFARFKPKKNLKKFFKQLQKKLVSPKDLVEGDQLVSDIKVGKKKVKKTVHGITKEQIAMLKKAKKKVLIREGLVFVPLILLALIISLFGENLLLSIIQALLS